MRGSVAAVNSARGMVAVLTEGGDYSIMEMLGDDPPEVEDEMEWTGVKPFGGEVVRNLTQGIQYDVYFQAHDVSLSQLRALLLL